MPRTPSRRERPIGRTWVLGEADRLAPRVARITSCWPRSCARRDQLVVFVEVDGDDASATRVRDTREVRLLDDAAPRTQQHVVVTAAPSEASHRTGSVACTRSPSASVSRFASDLAAGGAPELRQLPHLLPVHAAAVREEQDHSVRGRHEKSVSTKSSSRVSMPFRPLPPRRCARYSVTGALRLT
jgi:hypothetical protein